MASNRGRRRLNSVNHRELENVLLQELTLKRNVPSKQADFLKYIKYHFGSKYPYKVIQSVWLKLKNYNKYLNGKIEVLDLCSSSSSSDESENCQVTQIIDFDIPATENGPQYRIIEQITPPRETKPTRTRVPPKKDRKDPLPKKISSVPDFKKACRKRQLEEKSLLKKFRQQIIVEELLARDKKMLAIQNRSDKVEEAVAIELQYANRIQKDRVEELAMEMLKSHYECEGIDTQIPHNVDLNQQICLVDTKEYIPCENVITETLPNPDSFSEIPYVNPLDSESLLDTIYNQTDYTPLVDHMNISNSSLSSESKRKSRKRKSLSSKLRSKKKVEQLRQEIFIDKLIEISIPTVVRPHQIRYSI